MLSSPSFPFDRYRKLNGCESALPNDPPIFEISIAYGADLPQIIAPIHTTRPKATGSVEGSSVMPIRDQMPSDTFPLNPAIPTPAEHCRPPPRHQGHGFE